MRFALFALVCLATFSAADASPRRMLVLRNGEVIEGGISRDDEFYIVDLPDGQIRVKAADVELVCADIGDGYRQKRAAIQVGNVQDHLQLAQWCLRHELFGPAAVELADATIADPDNPMIGVMRHRLKMAMSPPPAPAEKQKIAAPGPSNDELDRMIRGLPHEAVEYFTQSVQPVLMNSCMGSGCHGPFGETPMRLFRVSQNKSPTRRMTQRNLYSLLQYIDRENPGDSPLVKACIGPHGGKQQPVFGQGENEQRRRIVLWALLLSQRPASRPESVASRPNRTPGNAEPKAAPAPQEDPFNPDEFNRRHAPEKSDSAESPGEGFGEEQQ